MKIIIHGGFFSESSQSAETKLAKQQALSRIAEASYDYLKTHTALETIVYAVELLENDELFNAGIGSQIQSDGKIRMSASLMDGLTKRFSGVINIEDTKNPIRVAEKKYIGSCPPNVTKPSKCSKLLFLKSLLFILEKGKRTCFFFLF